MPNKNPNSVAPIGEPLELQPKDLKPIEDQKVSDLTSDFVAYGGLVMDRLPNIAEVRDNTMVTVEKQGFRFLYMAIGSQWYLIKALHPTWEDLKFPATTQTQGASSPTLTAYRGGAVLAFAHNVTNDIYITAQMPHAWVEGSDISPHVHWTFPTAQESATTVNWTLTYTWTNVNAGISSSAVTKSKTVTIATDDVAHQHIITGLGQMDATGKKLSSILLMKLSRNVAVDDYPTSVYLLEFDLHYQRYENSSQELFEKILITE